MTSVRTGYDVFKIGNDDTNPGGDMLTRNDNLIEGFRMSNDIMNMNIIKCNGNSSYSLYLLGLKSS